MKSLDAIRAEVEKLAESIGASGHSALPSYGETCDFARPHIEADDRGYHLIVVERGREQSRLSTNDLDEILYRVFDSLTSALAGEFELRHRVERVDCRRMIFAHQLELLRRLSPAWAARAEAHQAEILRRHPFDDMSELRAAMTRELGQTGLSPEAAWQRALERYPIPAPGGARSR